MFTVIKPSFKRADTSNFIVHRNRTDVTMHALFWGMECAEHRRGGRGGDRRADSVAAAEAGVPLDLVDATRDRRRTGPHGKKLPAVFATIPVYRLVSLLEINFRKCMTVGALCASLAAMARLEEALLSDSLVLQSFARHFTSVQLLGALPIGAGAAGSCRLGRNVAV